MKTKKILHEVFAAGMVLAVIFILGGCAPKKNLWGDTKTGLILGYRMADGQSYAYRVTSDAKQIMEINQQKIEVTLKSYQQYTFYPSSPATDPAGLKVTIDTMHLHIVTPMAEMNPDMRNVNRKSITMNLSSLGKESGYEQASEITYSIGPETRNLGSEFQGFFPDFPAHPVKPGDTWSYPDSVIEKSGANWLGVYAKNVATLEGYETIGSRECARISVAVTGTISGKGNTQGVDTETVGEYTAKDQIWFDYKAGVMVKILSEGSAKSQTKTSGMREMVIPATRKMLKEVVLVEN